MLLTGERRGQPDVPGVPLPQAHFLERQLIHPRWEWDQATHELAKRFPMLSADLPPTSHAPGARPPGNGPFFVPDWCLGSPLSPQYREQVRALTRVGFRRHIAHACYVAAGPDGSDLLRVALRLAGRHRWTVIPLSGRLYLYPGVRGGSRKGLRDYRVPDPAPTSPAAA